MLEKKSLQKRMHEKRRFKKGFFKKKNVEESYRLKTVIILKKF